MTDKAKSELREIIEWIVHNSILANNEDSKEKVIDHAITAILKWLASNQKSKNLK